MFHFIVSSRSVKYLILFLNLSNSISFAMCRLSLESITAKVSVSADLLVLFPWQDLEEDYGLWKEETGRWLPD